MNLRSRVIRLAAANPRLRPHLLPILRKTAIEFANEKAFKEYMREHPDADPKNHSVKPKKQKAEKPRVETSPQDKAAVDGVLKQMSDDVGGMEVKIKPAERDMLEQSIARMRASGMDLDDHNMAELNGGDEDGKFKKVDGAKDYVRTIKKIWSRMED